MSAAAEPGPTEIRLRLQPHPSACAEARHAIRDLCRGTALDHISGDAELLTSELVSNAVRAARSRITLQAVRDPDALTVTVGDDGAADAALPTGGAVPSRDAESGRGLVLVSRLAERWGSTQQEAEHRVWFRI